MSENEIKTAFVVEIEDNEDAILLTIRCPYCGRQHYHGASREDARGRRDGMSIQGTTLRTQPLRRQATAVCVRQNARFFCTEGACPHFRLEEKVWYALLGGPRTAAIDDKSLKVRA